MKGINLAKSVFQVCVIALSGSVLFNKKFTRAKLLEWLKDLEPTTVAMEACATGHFWGRKLQAAGHAVKLVPAQHVKAFCRVHKNDSGDALAITEAAQRPEIHCVPRGLSEPKTASESGKAASKDRAVCG